MALFGAAHSTPDSFMSEIKPNPCTGIPSMFLITVCCACCVYGCLVCLRAGLSLVLLWYGLYFGILGRDLAEVSSEQMVSGRRAGCFLNYAFYGGFFSPAVLIRCVSGQGRATGQARRVSFGSRCGARGSRRRVSHALLQRLAHGCSCVCWAATAPFQCTCSSCCCCCAPQHCTVLLFIAAGQRYWCRAG